MAKSVKGKGKEDTPNTSGEGSKPPKSSGVNLSEAVSGSFLRFGAYRHVGPVADALETIGITTDTTPAREPLKEGRLYYFALVEKKWILDNLPAGKSSKPSVLVRSWGGIILVPILQTHLGTVRKFKKLFGEEHWKDLGALDALDELGVTKLRTTLEAAAETNEPRNFYEEISCLQGRDDRAHEAFVAAFDEENIRDFAVSRVSFDPSVPWPVKVDVAARQAPFDLLLAYLRSHLPSTAATLRDTIEKLTPADNREICKKWKDAEKSRLAAKKASARPDDKQENTHPSAPASISMTGNKHERSPSDQVLQPSPKKKTNNKI